MRQTSLYRRSGPLHAADVVQLQHFNRSIPFFMLLSDTGERRRDERDDKGGVDLRNEADMEAEVMELGMLHWRGSGRSCCACAM